MRTLTKLAASAAVAALASGVVAMPASAACTRLGFTVNDYGKEGPTRDAKSLLDKHIAKKMAERGVTKYQTGTKSVTCELFLNFIVFDEHTCTAEATVCWDGSALPKGEAVDAKADTTEKPDTVKTSSTKSKDKKSTDSAAKIEEPIKDAAPAKVAEPAKEKEVAPEKSAVSAKTSEPAKSAATPKYAEPARFIDPVKSSETPKSAEKSAEPVKTTASISKPKASDTAKSSNAISDGYPVPVKPDDKPAAASDSAGH